MRVAVIGSGMAAAGVLEGLSRAAPSAEVTLFEERPAEDREAPEAHADLYRRLRRAHGLSFPPPKTHFGDQAERRPVEGWGGIWRSRGRGGLTRYWGGSAVTFTERDLKDWPIRLEALAPYYRIAAERIGVSGRKDALSDIFRAEHLTRPPMRMLSLFEALEEAVAGAPEQPGYRFTAGASRLALDTRVYGDSRCRYTGDCMIGCRHGSIFDAKRVIDLHASSVVQGDVRAVGKDRRVLVQRDGALMWSEPFDRIYVCAGAPQTTAIIMRSLGLQSGPVLTDNAVVTFPILFTGRREPEPEEGYFGLTNLMIACEPVAMDQPGAQVQIYPAFDHLWRYFTPAALWPVAAPMGRALRNRMMIARIYLDGSLSQRYRIELKDGEPAWSLERAPAGKEAWADLWRGLRRVLNRDGFHVPAGVRMGHKTSSHYAASLPMGGGLVDKSGAVMDGVYVCDSAAFATAPACSPSFTIFALACRIAMESI
jgi:choline dehydrogenase-like flavoprotein